ncbi:uncharacterized protein TNCV_2494741 [Trichonephila clavipes]|nr:uncharacterized protein TNCV_2494741 [Trichonephila clavipes]
MLKILERLFGFSALGKIKFLVLLHIVRSQVPSSGEEAGCQLRRLVFHIYGAAPKSGTYSRGMYQISVDSVTTLTRDLGIDPEFPISKLWKKVYLFVYEGVMNQLQIPSHNSRSLQLMDDLPYYLSAIRYSAFCMFHNISDDDIMKA